MLKKSIANLKVSLIASDVTLEICQSNPSSTINFFQIFNNECIEKSPNLAFRSLCSLYHNTYLVDTTKFFVDKESRFKHNALRIVTPECR